MDDFQRQDPERKPVSAAAGEAEVGSADWIAEVSHELRLPIANLKLLVETLMDGAAEDAGVRDRMLSRAHQEVERLQKLVVNLLSAEEVAASRSEVSCQWLDLTERAAYAVETVSGQALSKGVGVEQRIAPGFRVFANAQQLDQVLVNLLENAVKYTEAGGRVWIASGDRGVISVGDTGIGMPAQEIPRIFQRFYRIDRTYSRGSTGLGLSIVKHIADLHGAKINVVSEERKGSVFSLEFPEPI